MYDELVKRLRELHPEEFGDAWDFAFACQQAMREAADAIEALSKTEKTTEELQADVRPVVLCRDCKCYKQSHYIDNHMECTRSGFHVHSVDFCSFGEKREES